MDGPVDKKEKSHRQRKKSGHGSTSKSADLSQKQLSQQKSGTEEKSPLPMLESKEVESSKLPKSGKGVVTKIPEPARNPVQ